MTGLGPACLRGVVAHIQASTCTVPRWPRCRRIFVGLRKAARASLLSSPLHSLGPGLLAFLEVLGQGRTLARLASCSEAVALKCYSQSAHSLERIFVAIPFAADEDDSLLWPPLRAWTQTSPLGHHRLVSQRVSATPAEASAKPKILRLRCERGLRRTGAQQMDLSG